MKLISFIHNDVMSYGILNDSGVVDLGRRLGGKYTTLKSLLSNSALDEIEQFKDEQPDFDAEEIKWLPVIVNPQKIICVGMNYADKRKEFGEENSQPTLFIRFSDTQVGHNAPVVKPNITTEFDYEGELAVIIGRDCYHVETKEALNYVAGYSCYMDGSVRDWQHTWYTAGKNWLGTGAFGPCLATRDEIDDPQNLSIKTTLNGNLVQNDNTRNMIHDIPSLISYISTFTPLSAGDVIITGSPGGVGKKRIPPLFLKNGDTVEVSIEKIGSLKNTIIDEDLSMNYSHA